MMSGYDMRLDMEMQRLAWHAACVMNVHLKRKVTPKQLLGKEKSMSKKDKIAKFDELTERLKNRRAE